MARSKIKKSNYDQIHSSVTLANSYEGNEIITLSNLEAFTSIICNNGNKLEVKCYKSPLTPNIHKQCLELFQTNMHQLYENSSWGLDLDAKNAELSHSNARFLIVTDVTHSYEDNCQEKVVAFTHFRFECSLDECNENNYVYCSQTANLDKDVHEPILYLYEIQIDTSIQRQSIGNRLMTFTQIIAMKMNMEKVMLTVFKSNSQAMGFYKTKLNYIMDESSPNDDDEADYEILSKVVQLR